MRSRCLYIGLQAQEERATGACSTITSNDEIQNGQLQILRCNISMLVLTKTQSWEKFTSLKEGGISFH